MFRLTFPMCFLLGCPSDGEKDTSGSNRIVDVPVDLDGDGWSTDEGDCADEDPKLFPGAVELCDGVDNDCNGLVDDEAGTVTWYTDADADGFGDALAPVSGCEQPLGSSTNATDCDDTDPLVNPGTPEWDCADPTDHDCDGLLTFPDADADGVDQCTDCDDADALVFPGATELCNGLDDDCDAAIDPDTAADATAWAWDGDADGYGDDAAVLLSCDAPAGYVAAGGDCDDDNAAIHPDAVEVCDKTDADDDCNGLADDADPGVEADSLLDWWADADGDGYGDDTTLVQACAGPAAYVSADGDCDDTDPLVHPGAAETDCTDRKDYNCDGSVAYADADGDGSIACDDCDDADGDIHPGATEVCNGADDDCDGVSDPPDAVDAVEWYADADGDTYGDVANTTDGCTAPAGYVGDTTDCDDSSASVNPGAAELCNSVDDDCDGIIDPDSAIDAAAWYADADGDSYGDAASVTASCAEPAGFSPDASDCDDTDAAVFPSAVELCNGLDDDCDGVVDPDTSADASVWYADADGDNYGSASSTTTACTQPSGYVSDTTDCDDSQTDVNPGADEVCDAANTDEDCDTLTDDDDPSTATSSMTSWYLDADGDTYGDASSYVVQCEAPIDAVADNTDCDDTRAAVHPGGQENCDALDDDEDCDGLADDDDPSVSALSWSTWYADADSDGYGAGAALYACDLPSGAAAIDGDCDDALAGINPAAAEICDSADTDEDCDGDADDDDTSVEVSGYSTWYEDADSDGYGDADSSVDTCDEPTGFVADDTDCDDTDATATTSCSGSFSGVTGTTWYTMTSGREPLYSMMTYHPSTITYIYNMYDSTGQYYDTAANTWTNLSAVAPYSQPWTSMAPYGGYLWMIRNSSVYRYAPTTDVWTRMTSITGSDDYNMTESDEYGVIYGHTAAGQIVEYDTTTGTITYVTTGLGSEYETRMAYDPGTRAIFFGAYNARNLYRMDIATGAITTMTPIPESQLNDIFCSDRSGHIYAAGATSGTTMYQYDIATDAWTAIAALPSSHGNNGSCTVSETGWLYVGTGSNYYLYRLELF